MTEWPVVRRDNSGGIIRGHRVQLDTSQVVTDMLHVNDPVNNGIPSEVDVEVEWFDLSTDVSRMRPPAIPGGPQALVLLELHSGEGFPEAFAFEKKGFRWRCSLQGDDKSTAVLYSKPGQFHEDEPEFPELPLHGRLFPVVDKLKDRGMPLHEIADVCDCDTDLIKEYLRLKAEFDAKHAAKQKHEDASDMRVDLHWHEVQTLFVKHPETATVVVELLDGQDQRKGAIEPIPVKSILGSPGLEMPRKQFHLAPPSGNKSAGLSSWLFPMCTSVVAPGKFAAVRMGLSAKVRILVPGDTPPQIRSEMMSSREGSQAKVTTMKNAPSNAPPRSLNNGYALQNGASNLVQRQSQDRKGVYDHHQHVDMPPPPPPMPTVIHRNL